MGLDDRDWYRDEINQRLGYKSWSFGFGAAVRRLFGIAPQRPRSEFDRLIRRPVSGSMLRRWLWPALFVLALVLAYVGVKIGPT